MLTDQNIGKGYYFGFINALPGPWFNETSDTVIFRNYASLNCIEKVSKTEND